MRDRASYLLTDLTGDKGECPGKKLSLEDVARALEIGAPLSDDDRAALVRALRRAAAMMEPTKPGQRCALTRMMQAERDRLLCTAAREFYPTEPAAIAAEHLAQRLARYQAGPDWRRDRTVDSISYRETLRGHCWAILKAIDRPLSSRRVREILATSCPISSPRI
jgi:hypothetical protein